MVGIGSIAQFIDAFDDRIQSRIKTDRVVRAFDIVVDGTRKCNSVDAQFCQRIRTAVGTVTADDDDRIDLIFLELFNAL